MSMIGFLCLALPLFARPVAAQAPAQRPEQQAPVFRTDSTLALVRFHVVRKHSYVDDLKPKDVILLEDGSPREFSVFEGGRLASRTIPIEIVLLFDTSGSVTGAGLLDPLAYQATLLDNLENVRLAVYAFNSTLTRHCGPTRDPAELAAALRRVRDSPSGAAGPQVKSIPLQLPPGRKGAPATWLFEAIMAAAKDSAAEAGQATRMLVVFSDGFPTTNTRPEEAVSVLSELGIPVYPVVLGHADLAARRAGQQLGWPQMAEMFMADFASLAELTGGRSFDPPVIDVAVVREILAAMAGQVLCEYVVGFQPGESPAAPRPHRLQVKLRSKDLGTVRGGFRTVTH
jgi:VWFA-related protein